jgi:hypothetical protein
MIQAVMNAADLRAGKQLSNLASQGRLNEVGILVVNAEDFQD